MPSAAKTKSGKTYRAPTDQARKQDRKKENKKNKKDRQQIRHAIAKCINVDDVTTKMLGLERQILGLDKPQFHADVLKKKQATLMSMVNRHRIVLVANKDGGDDIKRFNEKMHHYYSDVRKLQSLAEQERLAQSTDICSIPLPMGDIGIGESRSTQLMGPVPTKKKVDFRLPRQGPKGKLLPPGVPCGLPPVVSDSEDDDDYGRDDDDLAPVPIPDFDAPIHHPPAYGGYMPVMPLRKAPGPPPMPPPPMHTYNPMGIPMSSRPDGSAIISSAPVIHHADEDAGPISAAPQLRDLRKETVKLVPVQLKRAKPAQPVKSKIPIRPQSSTQQTAKSTDEAYNDFMKELEDLM